MGGDLLLKSIDKYFRLLATQILLLGFLGSRACAEPVTLEVAAFKGGYGIDFYEKCAREFEALHPNIKVNVGGSPRVWDQLTPRFATGTAPDICWPGWGMNVFALIFDHQLLPLDKYLQTPAIGVDKKWADTFMKPMLDKGKWEGKIYTLPFNFDSFAWWYNRKMFRENGWKPPKTYDDLLALCKEIRKKHIAPITFTGRYPQYMLDGFFFPWAHRLGGQQAFNDVDDLKPGAWKHPAFLKAAQCIVELRDLGYFQAGCIGMNHTESQMEFLVERAAMIPNGTWLYSEMRELLPKDFEMEYMLCPTFKQGVGDPTAVPATYDGKGWCIAATTKHPDEAAEFLKFLTSPQQAKKFVEAKGSLMSVKDLGELNVPQHLRSAMEVINAAKTQYSIFHGQWYPQLATAVQNEIRDLYNKVTTPEQFLDRLELASAAIRNDPHFKKFSRR